MENGDFFVTSIGSERFSAYSIAFSRVHAKSRTGASTFRSGASAPTPTSNRTWSLPLPVQPCATVDAPCWRAAATRCLTISGRDSADTIG
jgi:hypothetical protein